MPYEKELAAALEAAAEAGRAILELYEHFKVIPDAPADISTEADKHSQEIILSRLRREFPNDSLSAEETTDTLAGVSSMGNRLWVVDPIDGTRGFARKNGEFSVMIGFVEKGTIVVGVVFEPALKKLTYAVHGQGCWRRDDSGVEPERCHVSDVKELAKATLVRSRSRHGLKPGPSKPGHPVRIIETYSAGIKLALVARGEADIYANTYEAFHDWDICAGHILVEEAGGKVTGFAGQKLIYGTEGAWQRNGLMATNGHLHQTALAEGRKI